MYVCKKNLEKLSIYQVRQIAKEMGVRAPTKLTKEKLIEQILKIEKGEELPYFSNRGRPTLKIENVVSQSRVLTDSERQKVDKLFEKFKKEIMKIINE